MEESKISKSSISFNTFKVYWLELNAITFLIISFFFLIKGRSQIFNTSFFVDVTFGKILSFTFSQVVFRFIKNEPIKLLGVIFGTIFTVLNYLGNIEHNDTVH